MVIRCGLEYAGHERMKILLISMVALATAASTACNGAADSKKDTAASQNPQAAQAATPTAPDAPIMLRGTVVSASPSELVLKVDTGTVTMQLEQPFHVYARVASDMSKVKETSFIGVTTVKQPDGSERATEIHVFPEELRGLGEGSRMMTADTSASGSRMTNGSVAAPQSRMSNGSVSSTNGSTLVVQYAGGSQNVTVPPNTPVTEFKAGSKGLTAGDKVAVLAKKAADGSLIADRALFTAK
jgi:hypothetical protein